MVLHRSVIENYIEVIHLEYQGRERQYFQLQFLETEVENLDESCQNINGAMKQICRNSAYSKRKEQVTELQRQPQKILKMKKHGVVKRNVKVDAKVKQLMTSETQKLKTDVDFQKESNIGVSSDICKEKFQIYSKKLKLPKMKKPKSNGEKEGTRSGSIVKKFKGMVHEGPFYVCQICHRCLYKRLVQHFERNIKNESSSPINVLSFDRYLYICKTCYKKIAKGKVPCQSVSNKLEVYNFPSHFRGIQKLEKVLIAKRLLFKKITILPRWQMEKIPGTICNIPIDTTNITNMLP